MCETIYGSFGPQYKEPFKAMVHGRGFEVDPADKNSWHEMEDHKQWI